MLTTRKTKIRTAAARRWFAGLVLMALHSLPMAQSTSAPVTSAPVRPALPLTPVTPLTPLTPLTAGTASRESSIPYTVQPGDTLTALGGQLLENPALWPDVARFNRLKNANRLQPGQTLNIPVRLMKAQPVSGKVISVFGDVQLAGVNGAVKAEVGSPVPEGSQLRTGPNSSAVVELPDGSRVTLLPGTLAELVTSRGYATREPGASGSTTWFSGLMRLAQGALDTVAAKGVQRTKPLQIETPTSLLGVRGTEFRVVYDDSPAQNSRVEVLEGGVRADNTTQKSSADIALGKGAVLQPAVRDIKVVDLLKAPDLSATPGDILKPLALWPMPALEGAAAFRVQVAVDETFNKIVRNLVVSNGVADLADLPNGGWFARIRGIDAAGIEGYDSVKAVQVVLPPPPAPIPKPPRQWTLSADRLESADGRHVLKFSQQGLDASHTITATVTAAGAPDTSTTSSVPNAPDTPGMSNAPLAQATASGDAPRITMDLGNLQPGAALRLDLTVTQSDGARVIPLAYRFTALSGWGWAEGMLKAEPAARP